MHYTVYLLVTLLTIASVTAEETNSVATIPADQEEAYVKDMMRRVGDLTLITPQMNTNPLPEYDYDQLDYGMVLGSARTPKGRLWSAWVAGEDGPKAFMVAATSDDNGATWSKPRLVIDSQSPALPVPRSVIVGNLWTDPSGKLWFFFDQTMNHYDGRSGLWVSVCENPDDDDPKWSEPRRIWHGSVLNKPIITAKGEWLLPVQFPRLEGLGPFKGMYEELEPLRGANVFASSDQGKTWNRRGLVRFPRPDWPEHQLVELKDGRIWLVGRTRDGAMQSFSSDGGLSWTPPEPATFTQPVARFHLSRLASGRILLVKHGEKIDSYEVDRAGGRTKLTAWLSEDEGQTWKGGLMLDERTWISYPDGFQSPDGTIYVTYDRNRSTDGEILMAQIREEDILAGRLVKPESRLQILVSRPLKGRGLPFVSGPSGELEISEGEVRPLQKGAVIHTDRDYVFHELPEALAGRRFVFSPINKTEAVVKKAGMVYVLTPKAERNRADSIEGELLQAGFVKTDLPEFVINQVGGESRPAEMCSVYQKEFAAGDTIRLGRWGVVVF